MPHRPTPSRPFVRLVLAISLDGRLAPPAGGAAQLGGEGDRRALEHALAWGDACLIGAGTLRAHQCTCLIRSPQLLEQRRSEGRTEQPAAVVVSRSPDFSIAWRFFNQPLQRWLLAPEPVDQGFDRWFPLAPTWPERLQALGAAGIQRLVLLGGAQAQCRSVASRLRRCAPAHLGAPAPGRPLQLVALHRCAVASCLGATGCLAVRWC